MNVESDENFDCRLYKRPFATPLKAAWGTWTVREGWVFRYTDPESGRVGFGEAAPLPDSSGGTKTPGTQDSSDPCTVFARCSARSSAEATAEPNDSVHTAALLSIGEETPYALEPLREKGYRTFKIKVGMASVEKEWKSLQRIVTGLVPGEQIRLDPNRAWDKRDWYFWKPRLNGISKWIQFVEEPFSRKLPPLNVLREANTSPVPLALDESLTVTGLPVWIQRNWPGFWIIKPSLMGNPQSWMSLLADQRNKVVISSAFETGFGLSTLIRLAGHYPGIDHGLGTQAFFQDDWGVPQTGHELLPLSTDQLEELWKRLPAS